MSVSVGLIVPTLNAGSEWSDWLNRIHNQTLKLDRIIVIDSSSTDNTAVLSAKAGCEVRVIARSDFNHGTTRQMGAELLADMDIIIYMTQDALLFDSSSLECLVAPFKDFSVAATYGRQLPHVGAGSIGKHARLFNYPDRSAVRSILDADKLGIKVAFISNSFSAYRRVMLNNVGGFPEDNIFGEDTYIAAKLLLDNKKVAYCADALVYHSHDYSFKQDLQRCFDIGVFHSRESWILKKFGRAEGEGKKFVISELNFIFKNSPWLVPSVLIRSFLKYFGYKMGLIEKKIPLNIKLRLSMHRGYWEK